MDDLISRKAVYDAMVEKGQRSRRYKLGEIWELNGTEIREALDTVPSAHLEIIRCKDCEDYQTDWETSYPNRHYCATMDSMMPEDGFCSYAERRMR